MSVFFKEFRTFTTTILASHHKDLFTGDFNIHVNDEQDQYASEFLDIFTRLGLRSSEIPIS